MFVRLTTKDGVKINLNLNHIIAVKEVGAEGSLVILNNAAPLNIQESGQTFRNAVKKKSILPGNKDAADFFGE